jgi:DNA-binding transcriptional LysR family regulator
MALPNKTGGVMARNETKYMESVIALSEKLNFTRAAQMIHISQPMLTRNLAELEDSLGFRLFDRDRRNVCLNDAGRAYVEQARLALLYGERASQAARAVMQNADAVLHVGKSPYVDPFLVSTLLSVQLPLFPRLRIELSSQFSYDLIHELLSGKVDLAIANEPPQSPLLTTVKVAESPFYIAMSEEDELAGQPSVTLEAMADRSWILFERRLHPPLYDSVMQLAEERKVTAAKVQHVTAPEEAFPFVAEGSCVAFLVKAGAMRIARNGVTVRPLAERPLILKTYLASRADNSSKVLSELVRAYMTKISRIGRAKRSADLVPT